MPGKKNKKPKEPTVKTAPPQKKKRGREKKLTVSIGAPPLNEEEKPSAKPIALKKPKKVREPKGTPATVETAVTAETALRREKPVVVTFVCTGNTCRSAMAQYIFRDYLKRRGEENRFEVRSAGLMAETGSDMSDYAYAALREMNISVALHVAQQLTGADVAESDLVVCMTESHRRAIGDSPKVVTLAQITGGADVTDPYGKSTTIVLPPKEFPTPVRRFTKRRRERQNKLCLRKIIVK